jgi:hypothetical protein
MATRINYIPNRVIDQNGIADGASLYVYKTGTTTLVNLFSDTRRTVPVTNPYTVAAGASVPPLYTDEAGSIRLKIVSSNGFIEDFDPYDPLANSLMVTPSDFGAVGDGVIDDTSALQMFWDYVIANSPVHDCSGTYAISSRVTIGPAVAPSIVPARPLVGTMRIVALSAMNEMLRIRNLAFRTWEGGYELVGLGGTSYASRTCLIGAYFENCARLTITGNELFDNFAFAGALHATANNNFMKHSLIRGSDIGSGHSAGSLTGTWTTPVNSGSLGSTGQRTTINVSSFPSAALQSYLNFGSTQVQLRLNSVSGALFYVYGIDTVAGTATVYPQIDTVVYGTSGTIQWVIGGAHVTQGSDSNLIEVERLDATNCGRARSDGTLYPSRVHNLQANSCGTDECIGASPSSGSLGALGMAAYTESTNSYEQLAYVGRFGSSSFATFLSGSGGSDLSKYFMYGDPLGASGIAGGEAGAPGLGGIAIGYKGRWLHQTKPNLVHGPGSTLNLSGQSRMPNPEVYALNSHNLQLQVMGNGEYNRLFGFSGGMVGYIGTGTNGAPTGSFVFTPPAGGTINGGAVDATATFSNFSGPVFFSYEHTDKNQLTWLVRPICGWRLKASKTFDPPSIAAAGTTTTTVTATGAVLGDTFIPSFSLSLAGLQLTAYVSAADTVTCVFQNPTAGAVDLASGTLAVTKVL